MLVYKIFFFVSEIFAVKREEKISSRWMEFLLILLIN